MYHNIRFGKETHSINETKLGAIFSGETRTLLRSLSHLSALPLQSPHTLLLPLYKSTISIRTQIAQHSIKRSNEMKGRYLSSHGDDQQPKRDSEVIHWAEKALRLGCVLLTETYVWGIYSNQKP